MGNFISDLHSSKWAVDAVSQYLVDRGYAVRELEKDEQYLGDIAVDKGGKVKNIEIKYDKMSLRTGNFCFELSNGKRDTGISTTAADWVVYVVPAAKSDEHSATAYVFLSSDILNFVESSPDVKIKSGGDKKKFKLAIAAREKVVEAICLASFNL